MLSESDLHELLDFSAPDMVLSLYLSTNPTEGNADAQRLRLRNMLKEVPLQTDVENVDRFFNLEYDWSGRSVAVFSCAGRDFFRAYPLAVSIPSQVYFGERPVVKPLADALDAFGGYGVVLVDKQGARLFHFHMGELREQEGVVGEVVKHTKIGSASSLPGRRAGMAGHTHHADEVVERNMRESVEFAVHFLEENHVRRVVIGGTDDNVAQFHGMLPKAWQSLVVGTFAMSMTAAHSEVLTKAISIGQEARHRREARLVETVVTAAAKANGAVVGIDDTLSAIRDHRVQTLLVSEDHRQSGSRCENCGHLVARQPPACPYCGGALVSIPDVVELAVQSVMKHGGSVEFIHVNADLDQAGKLGAVLRY